MKTAEMPDILIYVPKTDYQPICQGVDSKGELRWDLKMKEPWHTKMFPVHYRGDLGDQWMWKCLQEKGCDWEAA